MMTWRPAPRSFLSRGARCAVSVFDSVSAVISASALALAQPQPAPPPSRR